MDLIEYACIRKDAMLQFLKTSGMGGFSCLAFGNLSPFYNILKRLYLSADFHEISWCCSLQVQSKFIKDVDFLTLELFDFGTFNFGTFQL